MLQKVGEAPDAPEIARDADIFISYQRDNADVAKRLAQALDAPNRRVWLDGQLKADAKWRSDIEGKLKRARCVVAIWSRKAATSGWVNYESFRAQQDGKLIAVTFDKIDANELPVWLADQQITDLRGWKPNNYNHTGWLKVKRLVSAKCSQLPDYRFKGWLGGGPVHERVTSLAFHPTEDARLVSTGYEGLALGWLASQAKQSSRGGYNDDGVIIPFDPAEHGQISKFQAPQPPTNKASLWRAQYSPDGEQIILSGRCGEAFVFDHSLSRQLMTLEHNKFCGYGLMLFLKGGGGAFREGVTDACITADGDFVTVAGWHAVIWKKTGEPKFEKSIQMREGANARLTRAVYCAALDGVVLGDRLGKVRVLDPSVNDKPGYEIADRADTYVHIALGPTLVHDGDSSGVMAIVSESPSDSEIKIHDWKNAAFGQPRPNPILDDAAPIHAIAMHPTAPVLAVGSNAVRPRLWDYAVNEQLEMERGGWHDRAVTSVAFSATGKYLAVGSEEGRISIWENIAQGL